MQRYRSAEKWKHGSIGGMEVWGYARYGGTN